MSRFVATLIHEFRIGRWCCCAALVACLGLSGCANLNLRGEGFADDGLSGLSRRLGPTERRQEPFVFSNKARQIDRNLGGP